MRRALGCLLVTLTPATALAQTVEQFRDDLRQRIRESHYPAFLGTFAGLASDGQMSLGTLEAEDGTELTMFALPWQHDYKASDSTPSLRLSASIGYSRARNRIDDLWDGALPGSETGLHSRYEAWAFDFGIGPIVPLPAAFTFVPEAHLGAAYIENTSYYTGPGAQLSSSLLDGLLFNWQQGSLSYGASFALEYNGWETPSVKWMPSLRYDVRQSEPVFVDDPGLNVESTQQWLTARLAGTGPIAATWPFPDANWRLSFGYRRLLGDSARPMGFEDFYELGAGLEWQMPDALPLLSTATLHGALQLGEDVTGWTVGVSVTF
ncbi:MAG: hypothetical protein KA020_13405 [Planctomycetes bacterium]|nr:hypothetical protein [Planctomycetota bacterium]MCC7066337.1 hypothetical protein [Planctomycetota bacterium]